MRTRVGWSLLLVATAIAAACTDESLEPVAPKSSKARPLGMFSTDRQTDPLREARAALARDARRRELRFLDAAVPGTLLGASRPEQLEIESGVWSPPDLFELGAQLFHHDFTRADGLGGIDVPYPSRLAVGFRGDVAAASCRTCHRRGGIAGAGDAADNVYLQGDGDHQSGTLERNAPALAGSGWIEIAASTLSLDLARQRDAAVDEAARSGSTISVALSSQGIDFGTLTVQADGSIDPSGLEGIDADLLVRPFGRKGTFATLRDVVEDELASRLGLQSTAFVAANGDVAARAGANGGDDPDGDGVRDEIGEGQLTTLTLAIAMLDTPMVEMPDTPFASDSMWAEGRGRFEEIGCAACHTPILTVPSDRFTLPSREEGAAVWIDLANDAAEPRLSRSSLDDALHLELYSDLKRHDMGDDLADARADRGVDARMFVTPPLWGLARSRPYLHDGRAPTLHDAIVAHGGEAADARDRYVALGELQQAPIRVFLTSLTRAPGYAAF